MKLPRRQFLHLAAAAGAAIVPLTSRVATAKKYPTRPIRLVVPFPPGGVFDAISRPWADKMKTLLGTVVVENIGGGGSSLGAAAAARARLDGYTFLMGGSIPHVLEALLKSRPAYNPLKDLEPIANVGVNVFAFGVHPSMPTQNLNELVDHAKSNPGKVSFGSAGVGSLNHLTGELFKSVTGTPGIVHVPYRGAGPALTDLISGQIPMIIAAFTGQVLEFHRIGKLRILALTSPARLKAVSDVPTVVEQGFPSMVVQALVGLLAPTGIPKPIVEQIAQATRKALTEPSYQQMLLETGFEPELDSTPERFRRSLEDDVARWRPVVSALGLKID